MALTTYTAGEVLTAQSLNDNLAYAVTVPASTPGGLVFIKSEVIGTTVGSVTVSDAFSATYNNYLITVSGVISSTNTYVNMTLGATTSNYYYAVNGLTYANVASNSGSANVAFFFGGWVNPAGSFMDINFNSPFLSIRTGLSMITTSFNTDGVMYHGGGFLNNTTSYTAFTLTPNAGTLTGGTIRVYGYANS